MNPQRQLRRLYFDTWSRARPKFRIRTAGAPRVTIPGACRTAANLADWAPNWKSHLIGAVLRARPGAFLDVGANIGQTLIDFRAARVETLYAGFEPNPRCVALLNDLVRTNHLSGCLIVPAALSGTNGIARLLVRPGSDTDAGASIDRDLRPGRSFDERLVPCFRFDDLRGELGIGAIGFVKIDVEGAEQSTLEGMTATIADAAPWIACEVLHRDAQVTPGDHQRRLDGLSAFLRGIGYEVLRIRKTPDNRRVGGLEPIQSFPNEVYSAGNQSRCDYLFVPGSDAGAVATLALV